MMVRIYTMHLPGCLQELLLVKAPIFLDTFVGAINTVNFDSITPVMCL